MSSVPSVELAIVLASDDTADIRIAGLGVVERAVRVAKRVGATDVRVVRVSDRTGLRAWRGGRTGPLLVIDARQLVHTPLVQPLIDALPTTGLAKAVVPENPVVNDLTVGSYAGAFVAAADTAGAIVAALAEGANDAELVAGATPIPHGTIARAPVATREQRREAHRVLYKILVKPQDNAITRYLYRPVSFPLTRLLVWTPITPNQISYAVAALVALGCWITAHASNLAALVGTIVLLVASYVDCCDGEVARVKLLSSRFGAWIDTVVDELSTVGYMVALGWHCHLALGPQWFGPSFVSGVDPWLVASLASLAIYLWCMYCIYYNIIVAVGSANSQDYVGRFEVAPGTQPSSVRLVPAAAKPIETKRAPTRLEWIMTYLPYVLRRDFISWASVVMAAVHLTHVAFFVFVAGGVVSGVVLTIDHVKLRTLRRSIERRGLQLESP